ncbi:stage VI sporulation protein D [Halobacillus massiliensis]|uniref:stage VI sporulation protein D n=1 Tax=Halobacillus massiliensis TaxID=1926286 RepID=UPI0009E1B99F|nr:stage VI sporulation protein D [Halobacillus massiliensis]
MERNQDFSFFLDESLWFKEGQGVNELLGISLEPQVSISDLGEDVRLHGFVELSGEYLAKEQEEGIYREDDVRQSGRVIQRVDKSAEGVSEFFHQFPVEITVSKDRVADLEDVIINIESFDYEIPESNQLRLHAELVMNGIFQEQPSNQREGIEHDEVVTLGPVLYKEEEVRSQEKAEDEESGRKETYQTFSEFFQMSEPAETEVEEKPEVQEEEVEEESESESPKENKAKMAGIGDEEENEEVEEEESPPSVNGFKQIFQHLFPNRDETYAQMKMYIVQEDETIEMIAKRYEVPVKQLEKVNKMEEEVTAGQVVYIPC